MKKYKISKLSKYIQKHKNKKFLFIDNIFLLEFESLNKLNKEYHFIVHNCNKHICEDNKNLFKNTILFNGEIKEVEGLISTGFIDEIKPDKYIDKKAFLLFNEFNFSGLYECKKSMLWYSGKVLSGEQLARTLGTNTANLYCENKFAVGPGVYYTRLILKNKFYDGLTCIRTDKDGIDVIETHILNFNKYIYNKKIKISFISKIRDNKKASSLNEVKEWIKQDLIDVKKEVEKYEGENWMSC